MAPVNLVWCCSSVCCMSMREVRVNVGGCCRTFDWRVGASKQLEVNIGLLRRKQYFRVKLSIMVSWVSFRVVWPFLMYQHCWGSQGADWAPEGETKNSTVHGESMVGIGTNAIVQSQFFKNSRTATKKALLLPQGTLFAFFKENSAPILILTFISMCS